MAGTAETRCTTPAARAPALCRADRGGVRFTEAGEGLSGVTTGSRTGGCATPTHAADRHWGSTAGPVHRSAGASGGRGTGESTALLCCERNGVSMTGGARNDRRRARLRGTRQRSSTLPSKVPAEAAGIRDSGEKPNAAHSLDFSRPQHHGSKPGRRPMLERPSRNSAERHGRFLIGKLTIGPGPSLSYTRQLW